MSKNIYIIDTSVCLTDFRCIYHYGESDVIIPMKVLEEIDKHKKRQDAVGSNARNIIREFDNLREKGDLVQGVSLGDNLGTLRVARFSPDKMPQDLNASDPDHVILTIALEEKENSADKEVVLASRDINMRVISDSLGIKSQDYIENKLIEVQSDLYAGFGVYEVLDEDIDSFYQDGYLNASTLALDPGDVLPNESIMLRSMTDEKKTALCRYRKGQFLKLRDINKSGVWGVRPRNKEQLLAMDMLLDPKINLITLVGKAGSGKTLMAIASGISQTISDPFDKREPLYRKIVISRPIQPLGKDIGYLPGTMEEKMSPWLMPIQDNLQFILGNDKATLEEYMEKGIIEVEALTYIRGRSIANAYIIIDEAQNLSLHEIKTILTRVGENTKIVLTGDIEQIDNIYLDETSTGLVHIVENFKSYGLSGHMTLKKGERSALATLAAEIL